MDFRGVTDLIEGLGGEISKSDSIFKKLQKFSEDYTSFDVALSFAGFKIFFNCTGVGLNTGNKYRPFH